MKSEKLKVKVYFQFSTFIFHLKRYSLTGKIDLSDNHSKVILTKSNSASVQTSEAGLTSNSASGLSLENRYDRFTSKKCAKSQKK